MQCDIDIIGEAGQLAEVELISATAATLAALGLTGCTIRVNDRRILAGILDSCGFATERQAQALISIDKLDKIGARASSRSSPRAGPTRRRCSAGSSSASSPRSPTAACRSRPRRSPGSCRRRRP
ncbi:Histidine--tRNA ligase [Clavibacter michiganensis subsp. michiganensis]|uniref:Histidine--tRNA ligase n=1 Tax=Clavibacter michiganensis subsp. michiganensis TaxID=33013 RepID=A0A251XJ47_CLAMM|nr:Histidine--tRNA ligase [Clavibacter michiganensis subsp. michiganensis]OUE03552.1 Histidine--tRNA ligase [Clavibacter michiganensis subsp. michiganensis]